MQVRPSRLLKYLNVAIGVAAVAVLAIVYWFVYRVLPKTSGSVQAPLSAEATVTRDDNGVPHIKAGSIEDALFLQGYVTAQDRLWQMDAIRRVAGGTISEIVGDAGLETDRESRRLRTRRLAEQHALTLPDEDRKWLAAFARGVNHFIETHTGSLPLEFTLLSYDPAPWTVADSLLVGMQMYRDLTSTAKDDLVKGRMMASGNKQLISDLFPIRGGGEFSPGSNAWVLSGAHTATGKPLLANDPHLQFAMPSTWYMVHLQAPGLNVSGVSLPGLPSVVVGHNDNIAWGVTNLHFDVQDLYVERLDLRTGQYVFNNQVQQARGEREYIHIKGKRRVEFTNYVTHHGPVYQTINGRAITLRWTAAERGEFQFPFVQLNRARNWTEFRDALRRFSGPGQNFVYADTSGNIGYQATGRLPIRQGFTGDVPADGSTAASEWAGFIPFEELPTAFNPPSGMIISANQNPFPENYAHPVNGSFAPSYRAHQIRSLLSARKGFKPEDMLTIQKDVYSPFSHMLARQVTQAFDRSASKDAELGSVVNILRRWNGQMEKGQSAPFILTLVYQNLRRSLGALAAPGMGDEYLAHMAGPVIERLLRERPTHWKTDFDRLLLQSLREAVEEGRRKQGRNPENWDYGVHIELQIQQPISGRIPLIGPYFNIGPYPMSGSSSTIKQTTQRLGPSMRFVADLSNWDRSFNNITIGQSGQFLSSHYKDQWNEYYVGQSLPMPWTKIEGKTLRFVPIK